MNLSPTIARERLIALGDTRAEVERLPDSVALELAVARDVPQPQLRAICPRCGCAALLVDYDDGAIWQCDAPECTMGAFAGSVPTGGAS